MDITKDSFSEWLPIIKKDIDRATFIAFDTELSGLHTLSNINAYDTQCQYFQKVRGSSKDFLVIQVGLCIFRYDKQDNCFKHKSYNFYIFPRPVNRMVPDHRFLCQASSIDFLSSQGFDFNKLFKDGITYLNKENEMKYRAILEESRNARAKLYLSPQTLNTISVPEEEKPFIEEIFEEIEEFISSDLAEKVLPKCNAFVRRLIYQTARGRIDNRASLETRQVENSRDRALVVTRPKTPEDRDKDEELKMREEAAVLKEAIGFSEVMNYLSESRKLMVGHNMMLDVLHCVDKFITNLPEEYNSFKECVHCLFPNLIDTKYMSASSPFKDFIPSTVLGHMVKTLHEEPFVPANIEIEDKCVSYTLSNAKEHEAGFDAYITGVAFLNMWKHLGIVKNVSDTTFENFDLLKPYWNRIFLMRIQDAPYIQLDGLDPKPSREHVFFLTFPNNWKMNDIIQLFSPFGNIYIAWIDDSSAYVALHKRDQAGIALNVLSQSDTYSIMTYTRRQAILAGTAVTAAKKPRVSPSSPKRRKTSNTTENVVVKKRTATNTSAMDVEFAGKLERVPDCPIPCLIKPRKRTISKTFEEDNSWE